jgi:hypothetical protein
VNPTIVSVTKGVGDQLDGGLGLDCVVIGPLYVGLENDRLG